MRGVLELSVSLPSPCSLMSNDIGTSGRGAESRRSAGVADSRPKLETRLSSRLCGGKKTQYAFAIAGLARGTRHALLATPRHGGIWHGVSTRHAFYASPRLAVLAYATRAPPGLLVETLYAIQASHGLYWRVE